MLRLVLSITLVLAATPPAAQDAPVPGTEQGFDLLQQGTRLILRDLLSRMEPALDDMGRALDRMGPALDGLGDSLGDGLGQALSDLPPMAAELMALIDDLGNYRMPEILPNGDILIRRKPVSPDPPKSGEIDL